MPNAPTDAQEEKDAQAADQAQREAAELAADQEESREADREMLSRHEELDDTRDDFREFRQDVASHDYRFAEKSADKAGTDTDGGNRRIGKRGLTVADLVKLLGLIAVFALMGVVVAFLWPMLSSIFEEGGVEALVTTVQQAGAAGVAMLLGLQLLQVIVAFIPGEVVQVAAGLMYGPWIGGLIVALGAAAASALVYGLVHWLGAPFVRSMVSDSFMGKFRKFEASGRLDTVVFILFLIPGMPKDLFTYLVSLTDMRLGKFLLLSTLGRLPGIFVSTYAASSVANGDMTQGIIIFAVAAAIAIAGILLRDRIIDRLEDLKKR